MTVIAIPRILRDKWGDDAAEALVELLNKATEERIEKQVVEVKSELEVRIEQLRVEIARTRAEIIKWIFIFWVGQIGALTSILFAFFRR